MGCAAAMINDAMLLSFLSDVGQALSTGNPAAAAFLSDDATLLLTEWLRAVRLAMVLPDKSLSRNAKRIWVHRRLVRGVHCPLHLLVLRDLQLSARCVRVSALMRRSRLSSTARRAALTRFGRLSFGHDPDVVDDFFRWAHFVVAVVPSKFHELKEIKGNCRVIAESSCARVALAARHSALLIGWADSFMGLICTLWTVAGLRGEDDRAE